MQRISAPAFPAVSASQLREWLRLDADVDADTLDLLLGAAVDHVANLTGQIVVSADYRTTLDPCGAGIYRLEITNATAVALTDADGEPIDQSRAIVAIYPARVLVTVTDPTLDRITATVTAGWADEQSVPAALRHAIAVYVGTAFDTRNAIDDATFRTIERLCRPYWRPVL